MFLQLAEHFEACKDRSFPLPERAAFRLETTSEFLNTYQVLRSDKLVFTRSSFEKLQERLTD